MTERPDRPTDQRLDDLEVAALFEDAASGITPSADFRFDLERRIVALEDQNSSQDSDALRDRRQGTFVFRPASRGDVLVLNKRLAEPYALAALAFVIAVLWFIGTVMVNKSSEVSHQIDDVEVEGPPPGGSP